MKQNLEAEYQNGFHNLGHFVQSSVSSQELGVSSLNHFYCPTPVSRYAIPVFKRNDYLIFLFIYFRMIEGPNFKRLWLA